MKSELKKKAVDYLGGCCLFCGFDKCLASLAFHHINPFEKCKSVSKFSSWTGELVEELDKCALLCHNCHSFVHNSEFNHDIFEILEI